MALWMARKHPDLPWCRYADDGLVHCRNEQEAQALKSELQARLAECRLEMHPTKTKIAYCKDKKRKGKYPNVKFDVRILAFALFVFAVGDFGLRWMHLQAALRQASLKLRLERLCLLLVTAVHQSIVCIPTPREIRVFPRHPESHLSMYNRADLHDTCFRTALSKSSWLMLSNSPF